MKLFKSRMSLYGDFTEEICRYRDAAADARQVIELDRRWVKGWSRLAAALFAMEEWSEVSIIPLGPEKELLPLEQIAKPHFEIKFTV